MMYGVKYTQNGETKMSFMASDNTEEAVEKFKRAMGNIKEKGIEIVNANEMTEEIKTQNEQKNTVATVGMRLSIL